MHPSILMTFKMLLIISLVPFIQMGVYYYISTMMLAFLLVMSMMQYKNTISLLPVLMVVYVLMLVPTIFYLDGGNIERNILKASREFLCFSVIYYFISLTKSKRLTIHPNHLTIKVIISFVIVVQFVFVLLQYLLLKKGIGLYFPPEWYILNYGTIPDELDIMWTKVRPSGTFGEPSYLGFISISLLVIVIYYFNASKMKILLLAILTLTIIISKSASGIISLSILLFMYYWASASKSIGVKMTIITLCVTILAALIYTENAHVIDRISNITDSKTELSGYYRIIFPLKVLYKTFTESPFGVPTLELNRFLLGVDANQMFDGTLPNGFFNVLINYGVFGLIIMFLVYFKIKKNIYLLIYIFLSSMFNGGVFTFDKAVVISITLLLAKYGMFLKESINIDNYKLKNGSNSISQKIYGTDQL